MWFVVFISVVTNLVLLLPSRMSVSGFDDSIKMTSKTASCVVGIEGLCDSAEAEIKSGEDSPLDSVVVTVDNMKCELL